MSMKLMENRACEAVQTRYPVRGQLGIRPAAVSRLTTMVSIFRKHSAAEEDTEISEPASLWPGSSAAAYSHPK